MKYEQAKHLKPGEFKRLWGVKLETFQYMVEIVQQHEGRKKKAGRPGKISREDQVLMTLEYWREYRTYFHIGKSWGVTESTACRSSDKKKNRELARKRVIGEHINRKMKIFKILAERYRNRRKRFGLRFNLIAGLYNYELRLHQQNNKQN
jgi:hypothetical protein